MLRAILLIGGALGLEAAARGLIDDVRDEVKQIREYSSNWPDRPRVYFEEWMDPMIAGIRWVSELIEIAGGEDVFAALRTHQAARDRIVSPEAVVAARPDLILASWCGKKVVPERIAQRPGWDAIPAVRDGRIIEIKSPLILQPGPAALSDGLDAIVAALSAATRDPARGRA